MINFDDFAKIEIRIGTVLEAEEVIGSEKLIKQIVDFGDLGKKQVLSGIKKKYKPSQLIGKQSIYVVNLPPRKIMGIESEAMLICAAGDSGANVGEGVPILLKPASQVPPGAKVG